MQAVLDAAPLLLGGFWVTLSLALVSLALATALGAAAASLKLGGGAVGRAAAIAYTTVVRGVPDLVTMLIVYFGGQRLVNAITQAAGWERVEVSTFLAGALALGFVYGAYMAETFRGAYQSIPPGQLEAARAYGLSRGRTLWRVTAPQLLRFALPGYANIWQVMAKSTALVSVIGLNDLVGLAVKVGRRERDPFTFLIVVLVAYLAITALSDFAFRRAERRLGMGA